MVAIGQDSGLYAGRRAFSGVVCLLVTGRRLASSTPAKNTVQPNAWMIQKLLSNPKKRARVPAAAFNKTPTRINTLAHKRLIVCMPATLDWRRASFHPEYTATPTTANTPKVFKTIMVTSHAPGFRIPLPGAWLVTIIVFNTLEGLAS